MSNLGSPGGDGNGNEDRGRPRPDPSPDRLVATLVRYEERPDRLTVHPAGADDAEVTVRWLTVDAAAAVDLSAVR